MTERTLMPLQQLTPAQQAVYDSLWAFLVGKTPYSLAVLEGYAGTGKTFLVSRLLADLTRSGARTYAVAVAAPTNKAVRVLKEKLVEAGARLAAMGEPAPSRHPSWPKIGCTCRSIHAFLGLKLEECADGQHEARSSNPATLREYDIAVFDECSMLDHALFEKTIRERGTTRILFVGDPAQLPPVKSQQWGLSPVFDRVDYRLRLSDVVRQAKDNPIIRLSVVLRQLIEAGIRADATALCQALPPISTGPAAAVVSGSRTTLIDYWLDQHRSAPETDTRIIAYTNDCVQFYNRAIHHALHGLCVTGAPFSPGERVIVHSQCEALKVMDETQGLYETGILITSEELFVDAVRQEGHPLYPEIPAHKVILRDVADAQWVTYVAADPEAHAAAIRNCFDRWRHYKALYKALSLNPGVLDSESEGAAANESVAEKRVRFKQMAKHFSLKGWALKKAFASLRHAYAMTAHKSQGSTFDCALVDFSDLAKIPDAFSFNRALYVAATRSREFLALVLTGCATSPAVQGGEG